MTAQAEDLDEFDNFKLVEETIPKFPKSSHGKKYNLAATAAVNDLQLGPKKYRKSEMTQSRVDLKIKPDMPEERAASSRNAYPMSEIKASSKDPNRLLLDPMKGEFPKSRQSVVERLGGKSKAKETQEIQAEPTLQQEAMMDAIREALREREGSWKDL